MRKKVAIVGNGPSGVIPRLSLYKDTIDYWIGADRGALSIMDDGMRPHIAIGDFDSITMQERTLIKSCASAFETYPAEKDATDLELALDKAYAFQPSIIYLFGVTGGRMDHTLINVQLLHEIKKKNIHGVIIDTSNRLELTTPGIHHVEDDPDYPNISFIPFSRHVGGLVLDGFYYALEKADLSWGSTLCISNKLISKNGTFSYESGILLIVKSRDALSH